MTSPLPMNRAARRAAGVKSGPETVPFQVKVYDRREYTTDDGTKLAVTRLQPIGPSGQGLYEEINGESAPILIKCEPVVVGRTLIARV